VNLFQKPSVIHFEDSLKRLVMKKVFQIGLLSALSAFLISCIALEIKENVKNPNRYFLEAYRQIERIHKRYPRREGRPHSIHVLIYEGSHRKLFRVTAPVWIANNYREVVAAAEEHHGFDFEDEYDIDWRGLDDLKDIGPGLLFELDDQKSKILIWLE
jgi:hypothetical protein